MTDGTIKKHIWAKTFTSVIGAMLVASLVFSAIVAAAGEAFKSSPVYTYLSYGISSVALLVALAIVKFGFKAEIKPLFKVPQKKYFLALPLIAAGCFFAFSNLNVLFVKFLSLFGYAEETAVLPEFSPLTFTVLFFAICLLPAILEEILFRGLIAMNLSFIGVIRSALLSAALFAFYHFSPAKTLYQFVLGFIFALVALKSGSVIPGTILHFINNLVVLILCFAAPEWNGFTGGALVVSVVCGLILLAAGLYIIMKPNRTDNTIEKQKTSDNRLIDGLLYLAPGLIVALAVWISNLLAK